VELGVCDGVKDGVKLGVKLGVAETDGVRDGVEDGVNDGVKLGVKDGVKLGVEVGVELGVEDADGVYEGVLLAPPAAILNARAIIPWLLPVGVSPTTVVSVSTPEVAVEATIRSARAPLPVP